MFVFFSSRKIGCKGWLDTSSIPCCLSSFFSIFLSQSRQLLDTWWINRANSCLLDSFSTPGGLIELLFLIMYFCFSIPFQHLHLSISIFSTPTSIDGLTPYLSRFTEDLFKLPHTIRSSFLSISLSIALYFLFETLSSHSNLVSQGFFNIFFSW